MIPRFSSRAAAAVTDSPKTIAATAVRRIGDLAAGDAAAWRGVKQAKDMPSEVLIARIGIHYPGAVPDRCERSRRHRPGDPREPHDDSHAFAVNLAS
jgi:hypothetical protein